jgi:CRP-like cAMP-binding protein
MNKKTVSLLGVLSVILFLLSACSTTSTGDVDLEATANAIAAATLTAEAANDAAIDAAVQATMTAVAPQSTPVVVYELTEEELANLIDQAVTEAIAASEEAAAQTVTATADTTVTEQEAADITYVVVTAGEALDYANELVAYYYSLYDGAIVDEAVASLNEIEAELEAINTNLQDIEDILNQGLDAVNATIDELNQTAADLSERADTAQDQAQTWMADFSSAQQAREETLLAMAPNVEANDRSEMVDLVNGFAGDLQKGLADGVLTYQEKVAIAQSGTNARAALEKFGGGQLGEWNLNIESLLGNVARGDLTTLRTGFANFSASLPALESRR